AKCRLGVSETPTGAHDGKSSFQMGNNCQRGHWVRCVRTSARHRCWQNRILVQLRCMPRRGWKGKGTVRCGAEIGTDRPNGAQQEKKRCCCRQCGGRGC